MQTKPFVHQNGQLIGFEVPSTSIGLRKIKNLLLCIKGVKILQENGYFNPVKIVFDYNGITCAIALDKTDRGNYYIGRYHADDAVDLAEVESQFKCYQPSLIRQFSEPGFYLLLTLPVLFHVFHLIR